MLKYGHKKPRSKIRFFQIGNAPLHQADLLRRSRTSWNISADSRLCQRPFWRWEADGFVPILNCTILTTNAWAHVFGVRLSRSGWYWWKYELTWPGIVLIIWSSGEQFGELKPSLTYGQVSPHSVLQKTPIYTRAIVRCGHPLPKYYTTQNLLNIISQKYDWDISTKNLDQGQNEREVEIPGSCSYCRWHNTGTVNDNCKVGSLQTFPRKFVIGKRGSFDAIKNIMKYCEQQLKWSWTLSCNARYLAREYGLNGGSNLENAQVQLFKHCSALDVLTNHFSVNIWSICTDFAGWRDRRCDQRLAAGHSESAEQTTLSIIHKLYRHHH